MVTVMVMYVRELFKVANKVLFGTVEIRLTCTNLVFIICHSLFLCSILFIKLLNELVWKYSIVLT